MRKTGLALAAATLMGVSLPATTADAEPHFAGFSTQATATPLRIALYEPVVPVPSDPQAELDIAYTEAVSATGPSATGRASWLWPGDAVGEGCKTFVELLGAGATGLCKDGYPVQVNARTPGDPGHAEDEPFPGSSMRASSSAERTVAKVGWSTDGDVEEKKTGKDGGGPPTPPDGPELPTLPVPGLGDLSGLGAAITGRPSASSSSSAASSASSDGNGADGGSGDEPPPNALLPEPLAALLDVGAMSSVSELATGGDTIRASGTSRISDLSLLDGLITADSVRTVTTATSDGRKAASQITSRVVGLALAGNPFTIDRDGVHAVGQPSPVPGLPDDPAAALDKLGIAFELPQGRRSAQGESATADLEGLRITIDTRVLRSQIDTKAVEEAVAQVTGQLPDEAAQLKSAVGALFQLSPKVVITAGNAAVETTTVQGVQFPTVDVPDLPADASAGGPSGGLGVSGSGSSGGAATTGGLGAPAGGSGAAPATDVQTAPVAAGLPPLASVPGALLVGGLILASGVGWWLQRIGGLVVDGCRLLRPRPRDRSPRPEEGMSMTSTPLSSPAPGPVTGSGPATVMPRAGAARSTGGTGAAPLRNNGYRVLQVVLFVSGAVLLPLGLVVIILGWYGAAHTPYQYDQLSYLVSGGLLGLGLTFCGGFLYFGAWLARIASDNRDTAKRLSDTLLVLADVVSHSATTRAGASGAAAAPGPTAADRDPGAVLVVAGSGRTVHRRDCALVAHRDDLAPAGGDAPDLTPCRLCRPV